MEQLTERERALAAVAAAVGSNRGIENHTDQARKAGLNDAEIAEAARIADKVRQEPDAATGCCSGHRQSGWMPC